jgi:hypothetical protein
LLKILRYLAGTKHYAITYSYSDDFNLIGYCDSDYAADKQDRLSIFGGIFTLGGGAVAWMSQKATSVVASTMEAELIACNENGKTTQFLYSILQRLLPEDRLPITIRCDNLGTIQFIENPRHHKRSKHIDTRYFYVRQLLEDNIIAIEHVESKGNAADMLTKPLKAQLIAPALKTLGIN